MLREGDLLAIFPEGAITRDGSLQPFKGGVMKILEAARADGIDAAGDPDGADQSLGLVLQPRSKRATARTSRWCGRSGAASSAASGCNVGGAMPAPRCSPKPCSGA